MCWLRRAPPASTRFIYLSSVAVYGVNRAPLVDEAMPTPPVGQTLPRQQDRGRGRAWPAPGCRYVIVRPASTYGPRGTAWTVGPVEQIKRGRLVLLGRDTGLVTPGYIDNVVDGLWLALTHPAALGETFNLCDDRAVTFREFYLAYARMLGRSACPPCPPGWPASRPHPPANLRAPPAGPAADRSVDTSLPVATQPVQHRQGPATVGLRARGRLRRRDAPHRGVAAPRRLRHLMGRLRELKRPDFCQKPGLFVETWHTSPTVYCCPMRIYLESLGCRLNYAEMAGLGRQLAARRPRVGRVGRGGRPVRAEQLRRDRRSRAPEPPTGPADGPRQPRRRA